MDHGYPVDPKRQCEAKVKGTHHQCKNPAIVDRHFCAYHNGLAGPRFDPFRDIGEEEERAKLNRRLKQLENKEKAAREMRGLGQ